VRASVGLLEKPATSKRQSQKEVTALQRLFHLTVLNFFSLLHQIHHMLGIAVITVITRGYSTIFFSNCLWHL